MNVGLPVFTGFPLCVSCPFEDTRRFFTKPEKDESISQMAMSYGSNSKDLGISCFSSNLTTPWSIWSQWGLQRLRRVPGEDRCFLWGIPRKREGWNSTLLPSHWGSFWPASLHRLLLFPKGDESEAGKGNLPSTLLLFSLSSGLHYLGNCKVYLLMEGPCNTSQLGQWYRSMSAAFSSSTPTQLKKRKPAKVYWNLIFHEIQNCAVQVTYLTFKFTFK